MTAGLTIERFTAAHLPQILTLHQKTFSVVDDPMQRLGARFLQTTYQFFLDDALSFGFVALHERQIIGYVVGRLDLWGEALDRYRRGAAIVALLSRPRLIFDRHFFRRVSQPIRRVIRSMRTRVPATASEPGPVRLPRYERLATLAIIGVDADFHQLRASEALLDSAESYCRQQGMLHLRAGVERSNVKSRFLYRRRAYVEAPTSPKEHSLLYHLALQPRRINRDAPTGNA